MTRDMRSVAIWFFEQGRLRWFCFADRRDAVAIAARVQTMFRRPAVVQGYWWEPTR